MNKTKRIIKTILNDHETYEIVLEKLKQIGFAVEMEYDHSRILFFVREAITENYRDCLGRLIDNLIELYGSRWTLPISLIEAFMNWTLTKQQILEWICLERERAERNKAESEGSETVNAFNDGRLVSLEEFEKIVKNDNSYLVYKISQL